MFYRPDIKPVYEFLMWDNCSNNCQFCYYKQHYNPIAIDFKRESCRLVEKFLNSDKFVKGSHILLVGGEIFDDNAIHDEFIQLIKIIAEKMLNFDINLLYVNTNLIYKDMSLLTDFLKIIDKNNLFERLKFTTSYDIVGRFRSENDKKTMLDNLKIVKQSFPDINIVVNSILTNACCDAILNNTYDIKDFSNEYDVTVNAIPYIALDRNLLAKKAKIFSTLVKIDNDIPNYLTNYIYNMDIAQEKRLYIYKDHNLIYCSSDISDCGHSVNFKKYSDTDSCFICDLKNTFIL